MKPHTIAETLILPAAIDMVKTTCGAQRHRNSHQKLCQITLLNKAFMLLLAIKRKLTERVKNSSAYSLQMDVSWKCQDAHALAFVRYTRQGMLFTGTFCSVSRFPSTKGHMGYSVCCTAILTKNR